VPALFSLAYGLLLGWFAAAPLGPSLASCSWGTVVAVLMILWHFHMRGARVPRVTAVAAMAVLALELRLFAGEFRLFTTMWAAVFVYLMVWTLAADKGETDLQCVAAAALLLSIGVLTTPLVALTSAALSCVFLLVRIRPRAEAVGFGLLLFTPAALCGMGGGVLRLLHVGPAHGLTTAPTAYSKIQLPDMAALPAFALAYRLRQRSWCATDAAYAALAVFAGAAAHYNWFAGAIAGQDLLLIAAGGAPALFSVLPARDAR
jgi:hypothetical protein